MTQLLPNGKQHFMNNNGQPLANGRVYHYYVGTNNPKDTFQDAAETIPNTNPIILNARGEAAIYGSGPYRQVLQTSAGGVIWDQVIPDAGADAAKLVAELKFDLADGLDPEKGDAMVGYRRIGSSTVNRTVHDKLQEVASVTDYASWAEGSYATTIQSAINDLSSVADGQGKLIIPLKGTFNLEHGIALGRDVVISGEGLTSTILQWNGDGAGLSFQPGSFNPGAHAVENLMILGGNNPSAIGISLSDTFGFRLENFGVAGFVNGRGLHLHNRKTWTEGTVLLNVRLGNNKVNLALLRDPTEATDSFGYSRFLNVSLDVRAGQIGMLVGDDSLSTLPVALYNSILNCNIWLRGDEARGIVFGSNGIISDGNGLINGEGNTGSGGQMVGPNTLTSGFRHSDVFVRSSPLNQSQDQNGMFRDFKYRKIRDLSEQRPGRGTAPEWFRVCRIDPTHGLFTGRVSTQSQFGASGFRTATCDFAFGSAGGVKPQFMVNGEGFNGASAPYSRFKIATDGVNHYLYFLRSPFAYVCTFEYSYDWAYSGTVELWDDSLDPSLIPGMTVVYDSFVNAAQQVFNGDEQIFSGQRVTFNTNGGSTIYNVPHSLGVVPEWFNASAISADATSVGLRSVSADASNIVISFNSTTPVGVGNIRLSVEYARKGYQKQFRPS